MGKKKKKFDSVEMMRSLRANLSVQIEGMTREEERDWLASQELKDPFLERLRRKAAQQDRINETHAISRRFHSG